MIIFIIKQNIEEVNEEIKNSINDISKNHSYKISLTEMSTKKLNTYRENYSKTEYTILLEHKNEELEETDEKNGVNTDNDKENEEKYSNIVFAQLVPITNNMIEFGLDVNIAEEIILPLIEKYKISPELSEAVLATINIKKQELGNNSE